MSLRVTGGRLNGLCAQLMADMKQEESPDQTLHHTLSVSEYTRSGLWLKWLTGR